MQTTTLNKIKAHSPCKEGWSTLLKSLPDDFDHDAPLSFLHILESNGIDHAIWALRTDPPLAVAYAVACAEAVLPIFEKEFPNDYRPRKAIEAVKSGVGTARAARAAWAARAARAAARAAEAAAWAANPDFDKVETFKKVVG